MTCKGLIELPGDSEAPHYYRQCDVKVVHKTQYCFDHGRKELGKMYSKRTRRVNSLRKLDEQIADLESALETR